MDSGQGRTVAATAGMLLGLAAMAVAAPAATAAAPPAPAKVAVAVGRSADGEASFRLVGRRLTVRLGGPVTERRREWVELRCGEALFVSPNDNETWRAQFVVAGAREVVAQPSSRTFRALLSRDVASRATWCGIVARRGDRWERIRPSTAQMRVVRGAVRGCHKAGRERIEFEDGPVVAVRARFNDSSGEVDTYRVCLRPNGRFLPFALGYSGGGGAGGSEFPRGLLRSGRWFAWSVTVAPHFPGAPSSTTGYRARLGDMLVADEVGPGEVTALAPSGTVATLDGETHREAVSPTETVVTERRRLYVTAPAAQEGTLIATASAIETTTNVEPITGVALSADGRTVTWSENGIGRSAQMP